MTLTQGKALVRGIFAELVQQKGEIR